MSPLSPYSAPHPILDPPCSEATLALRRGGAVPQKQFPVGSAYARECASEHEHAILSSATGLAWRMIGNGRSRTILKSALLQPVVFVGAEPANEQDVHEAMTARLERCMASSAFTVVIQQALPDDVWGYCEERAYMELNISATLLSYADKGSEDAAPRAVFILAITIARQIANSIRLFLSVLKTLHASLEPAGAVEGAVEGARDNGDTYGGEYWEEQYLGGAVGMVVDKHKRHIAQLIFAKRSGGNEQLAWFEVADQRIKGLCEGKADEITMLWAWTGT